MPYMLVSLAVRTMRAALIFQRRPSNQGAVRVRGLIARCPSNPPNHRLRSELWHRLEARLRLEWPPELRRPRRSPLAQPSPEASLGRPPALWPWLCRPASERAGGHGQLWRGREAAARTRGQTAAWRPRATRPPPRTPGGAAAGPAEALPSRTRTCPSCLPCAAAADGASEREVLNTRRNI